MAEPATKNEKNSVDKFAAIAILNNEERLHRIQLPHKKEEGTNSIRIGPTVDLIPGWNFVPRGAWQVAKQIPSVALMLESLIQPMKAPEMNQECVGKPILEEGPEIADSRDPFAKLDEVKAASMVRDMFDEKAMREILVRGEKRERVVVALRAKIELITKAAAKKAS